MPPMSPCSTRLISACPVALRPVSRIDSRPSSTYPQEPKLMRIIVRKPTGRFFRSRSTPHQGLQTHYGDHAQRHLKQRKRFRQRHYPENRTSCQFSAKIM